MCGTGRAAQPKNEKPPAEFRLSGTDVIDQKIDYIHNNPVVAGIDTDVESYYYSSANPESPLKALQP
ncbi:hypothetical protein JYT51_01650 [Candidatus Amoebophilus asiaticus]|nr:hypothetical protein [Candidatus Amoebophilus asiaticus]